LYKQEEEEEAICLLMKSLAKREYSHRDEILKKRADAEIDFFSTFVATKSV
jgi:hypothetical protein